MSAAKSKVPATATMMACFREFTPRHYTGTHPVGKGQRLCGWRSFSEKEICLAGCPWIEAANKQRRRTAPARQESGRGRFSNRKPAGLAANLDAVEGIATAADITRFGIGRIFQNITS
jgi:hypothetical protein